MNVLFFRTAWGRRHWRTVPVYPMRIHKYYTTWKLLSKQNLILVIPLCLQVFSLDGIPIHFSEINVYYTSVKLTCQFGKIFMHKNLHVPVLYKILCSYFFFLKVMFNIYLLESDIIILVFNLLISLIYRLTRNRSVSYCVSVVVFSSFLPSFLPSSLSFFVLQQLWGLSHNQNIRRINQINMNVTNQREVIQSLELVIFLYLNKSGKEITWTAGH